MSFLDKIKSGVSQAGNTAKNTVEETKLRAQIKKNNEVSNTYFLEIGKEVYTLSSKGEGLIMNESIAGYIEQINQLVIRNAELEKEIQAIWNQKKCICGRIVSAESKFCSACGHKFEEEKPVIIEQQPQIAHQSIGNDQVVDASKFICAHCDAELEEDASFCGSCGTPRS